jgi:hypothetical protein
MKRGLRFAVIGVLALGVMGLLVMGLWNWLVPALFGGPEIGFWQALGLLLLSRILFGSFGGRSSRDLRWRRRMMERWEAMTPQERERLREGLKRHCRVEETAQRS